MRPLAFVAVGLSLAGVLIAVTLGVFLEINVGTPAWLSSPHAVATSVSRLRPSHQARLTETVEMEPSPQLQFVTVRQPVPMGNEVLPAGTQLEFVSRADPDVWVRYKGAEYALPISATDLK
jgi:hypothetical protein